MLHEGLWRMHVWCLPIYLEDGGAQIQNLTQDSIIFFNFLKSKEHHFKGSVPLTLNNAAFQRTASSE